LDQELVDGARIDLLTLWRADPPERGPHDEWLLGSHTAR
jgi:hypothetical protein